MCNVIDIQLIFKKILFAGLVKRVRRYNVGHILSVLKLQIKMFQLMAIFHLYLRGPGATEFHQLLRKFGPLLTNAGNR